MHRSGFCSIGEAIVVNNTSLLISVVVCTYNRAQLLHSCLQSLDRQTANKRLYEIIIIDNNSTDDTQQIVRTFAKRRHNIRLVAEKKRGHSYARNAGWKNAKGRYVAYIDDDAFADRNWIEEIISFTKKFPAVGVFGGPYKRHFLTPPPYWFPDGYGTLDLGRKIKQIHPPKEWLTGTNMIFQKDIFKKYSGFDTRFGMKGKNTVYGEETDLMLRLHKSGEQIYYVPMINVSHLVADYKYNLWWLLKSDFFHSYSSSQFIGTKFNFMKGTLFLLWSILIFPFSLFDLKIRLIKTRVYYGLSNIFLSFGQIAGSIYKL